MKLMFSEHAWDDYLYWHRVDPKLVHRIHKLIEEAQCSPFSGLGKPERLRHHLSGYWSRRINIEHRMVYQVMDDAIYIVQLRLHY